MTAHAVVSIIIPTYRRPVLLRRAILSALDQEGPALQVCVYDNNSGDETREVVEAIAARDPRLRYFCHPRNIGGLANFQFGLAHVDTPYFTFLSDDDLQLPGFLSSAMEGFRQFPEASFWGGLTVRMSPDGRIYDAHVERWPREGLFEPPHGALQMLHGKSPTWCGVMFRREVIEQVGLLDMEVNGPSDVDYLLRIAVAHPFIISKRPVAIFMLNPDSFSESSPLAAFWPGWLKMIANLGTLAATDAAVWRELEQALNADGQRMLFRRGASALAKRNYQFARDAALVLRGHYHKRWHGGLLRLLAGLCSTLGPVQWAYSGAYRVAVDLSLRRRQELQQRYAHLAQRL